MKTTFKSILALAIGAAAMTFASCSSDDETVISEEEYLNESGLTEYEQKFGHGGKRVNAGRKNKYSEPLKFQIRVTEEEKEFIAYAREHHLDYTSLMQE